MACAEGRAIVCAIALKEELYIEEWIVHHLRIGFDSIVIYDNSDENTLAGLPDKFLDRVTIVHYPGRVRQMSAYADAATRYNTWCAFIDVDEFIVLRKHPDIKSLLAEVAPEGGALTLNWVMFGSSGHAEYSPEPVTKRFTWRAREANQHIKTIAYLPHVATVDNPHSVSLKRGAPHDCHGNWVEGAFNPKLTEDIACVYHYFTKSRGEFLLKRARGRADIEEIRGIHEFEDHDINEIEDLTLA